MKIAIIGSGNVGKALAGSATKAGHNVTLSAHDPQHAADAETRLWVERARVFKPIQATAGMRAVAAEIARTAPLEGPRLPMDSMTDSNTTEVRVPTLPTPTTF